MVAVCMGDTTISILVIRHDLSLQLYNEAGPTLRSFRIRVRTLQTVLIHMPYWSQDGTGRVLELAPTFLAKSTVLYQDHSIITLQIQITMPIL